MVPIKKAVEAVTNVKEEDDKRLSSQQDSFISNHVQEEEVNRVVLHFVTNWVSSTK